MQGAEVDLVLEEITKIGAKNVALQIPSHLLKHARQWVLGLESGLKYQDVVVQGYIGKGYFRTGYFCMGYFVFLGSFLYCSFLYDYSIQIDEVNKILDLRSDGDVAKSPPLNQTVSGSMPTMIAARCLKLKQHYPQIRKLAKKLHVLADNNYSECCVDEITAAHVVACDLIVHFGHCCYSAPSIYPTLIIPSYHTMVSGSSKLDDDSVRKKRCAEFLVNKINPGEKTCVYFSDDFDFSLSDLTIHAAELSDLDIDFGKTNRLMKPSCKSDGLDFGRKFGESQNLIKNIVYFGGSEDRLLHLVCLKYFVSSTLYAFDPATSKEITCMSIVRKLSTRRSHLIERAKEADIIGILIGTLSVRGYREAIDFSRNLVRLAGKKSYTFVVGKINVAKLANFAEIDAFVLISCAETSLNDHSEFFKPVLSVCELNYALNPNATWDGSFDLDFSNVVKKHASEVEQLLKENQNYEIHSQGDSSSQVALRGEFSLVPKTAASFLQNRSWQGLEMKLEQNEVCKIEPGLSGIPMKYDKEF